MTHKDRFEGIISLKMERDKERFGQLQKVQNQLQDNARQDVLHVDKIKKRIERKETKALVQIIQAENVRKDHVKLHQTRHTRVQLNRKQLLSMDTKAAQSMADYEHNQNEIKRRQEASKERDRLASFRHKEQLNNPSRADDFVKCQDMGATGLTFL